jgi:hypothetical protein
MMMMMMMMMIAFMTTGVDGRECSAPLYIRSSTIPLYEDCTSFTTDVTFSTFALDAPTGPMIRQYLGRVVSVSGIITYTSFSVSVNTPLLKFLSLFSTLRLLN